VIARKHRFHGYSSLRYAYRQGVTVRGQYSTLKYARNNRRTSYRVAVVVSKKVSKSAVMRNRIRRRIYEAVRENIVPNEPYDLIFTVFSDIMATMPAPDLQAGVASKLRGARIATIGDGNPDRTPGHDIVKTNKERK
jgi:ribonuclease P protein component